MPLYQEVTMAYDYSQIALYCEIDRAQLVSANGSDLYYGIRNLRIGANLLIQLTVRDSNLNPINIDVNNTTFYAGLAADDFYHVALTEANNPDFNTSTWADPSIGKIDFVLDLSDTDLVDDLGTSASKTYGLSVWADGPASEYIILNSTLTINNAVGFPPDEDMSSESSSSDSSSSSSSS